MAIDFSKIKAKHQALTSKETTKSNHIWKPKPGKQVVRIVPYKYCPDNPFIELKFHYNINKKTYLSPDSFGRPDPIVEFSNRLKKTGDKEDWRLGRSYEPKMRTFVPVIVRGEESEGVKFWGFGKQVYQELLSIISDPDFGDITDLTTGRDVVIEFKTEAETGKDFPETSIRVKPNVSPAVDPKNSALVDLLGQQINILDLFPEKSYDELKEIMNAWLNPEESTDSTVAPEMSAITSSDDDNTATAKSVKTTVEKVAVSKTTASPSKVKSSSENKTDVDKVFGELFNEEA